MFVDELKRALLESHPSSDLVAKVYEEIKRQLMCSARIGDSNLTIYLTSNYIDNKLLYGLSIYQLDVLADKIVLLAVQDNLRARKFGQEHKIGIGFSW